MLSFVKLYLRNYSRPEVEAFYIRRVMPNAHLICDLDCFKGIIKINKFMPCIYYGKAVNCDYSMSIF